MPIAPLFESLSSLCGATGIMAHVDRAPALSRRAGGVGRRTGGDDRLLRLQQGDRIPGIDVGALRCADELDRAVRGSTACMAPSFTDAAARSAAAAGRPMPRSWPSRRAPIQGRIKLTEQGEVISARYSVPEIAIREFELVVGAVLVASFGGLSRGTSRISLHSATRWREFGRLVEGHLPGAGLWRCRLRRFFPGGDANP